MALNYIFLFFVGGYLSLLGLAKHPNVFKVGILSINFQLIYIIVSVFYMFTIKYLQWFSYYYLWLYLQNSWIKFVNFVFCIF